MGLVLVMHTLFGESMHQERPPLYGRDPRMVISWYVVPVVGAIPRPYYGWNAPHVQWLPQYRVGLVRWLPSSAKWPPNADPLRASYLGIARLRQVIHRDVALLDHSPTTPGMHSPPHVW